MENKSHKLLHNNEISLLISNKVYVCDTYFPSYLNYFKETHSLECLGYIYNYLCTCSKNEFQSLKDKLYFVDDDDLNEIISTLQHLHQIKCTYLTNFRCIKNLCFSLKYFNITTLNLSDQELYGDSITLISNHLKDVGNLKILNLNRNHYLGNSAITLFQNLKHIPKLEELQLMGNERCIGLINDNDIQVLADNIHFVQYLIVLNLQCNEISENGISKLKECSINKKLSIDVSGIL